MYAQEQHPKKGIGIYDDTCWCHLRPPPPQPQDSFSESVHHLQDSLAERVHHLTESVHSLQVG
jgi:hypothetical protein